MEFKTISEFKKKLELGVKLHGINHTHFNGRDKDGVIIFKDLDLGIREVSIKQTNSFALKTTKKDGTVTDSWCGYPKASECVIKDNTLVIYQEDFRSNMSGKIKILTYKPIINE